MPSPHALRNDSTRGILEIIWDDQIAQHLDNAYLRSHCQCAECVSIRRRTGGILSILESVTIADIRLIGHYAVQFVFSDGHERGIYPWAYLRSLNT